MLALITAASLSAASPPVSLDPLRQPKPVICLALAPRLVDSVEEGIITRDQAAGIFLECLKQYKGKGAQY